MHLNISLEPLIYKKQNIIVHKFIRLLNKQNLLIKQAIIL